MLPRLCRGFSFSTTLTLSFLSSYRFVRFEPIDIFRASVEQSPLFPRHAAHASADARDHRLLQPGQSRHCLMLFPFLFGVFSWLVALLTTEANWFFFGSLMFCFSLTFLGFGILLFLLSHLSDRRSAPLEKRTAKLLSAPTVSSPVPVWIVPFSFVCLAWAIFVLLRFDEKFPASWNGFFQFLNNFAGGPVGRLRSARKPIT